METTMPTSVDAREKDYTWRGPILSKSIIADILFQVDIVDVIRNELQKNGIALRKRKRKNEVNNNEVNYLAKCPFHGENSPSFQVNFSRQSCRCHGCGFHGNAIDFLVEYRGWTPIRAIQYLAKRYQIKIRYGRIYKEDYFEQYDSYLRGEFNSLEGFRYPYAVDDYTALERDYSNKKIQELTTAISVILGEQEKKYNEFRYKSLEQVLGYQPDSDSDTNHELMMYTEDEIDYDAMISDIQAQTFGEEEEYRRQLTSERVENLKDAIRGRTELLKNERQENERQKLEAQRVQQLLFKQQVNIGALSLEVHEYKNSMDGFFGSAEYGMDVLGDSLIQGSMGKFVCIYSREQGFMCIFGAERYKTDIPSSWNHISSRLSSGDMAENQNIYHKGITIPKGSIRLGGAQFLVLQNNSIVVSGQSGDFFGVSHFVVQRCLEQNGFNIIFLDDCPTLTPSQVYTRIQNQNKK